MLLLRVGANDRLRPLPLADLCHLVIKDHRVRIERHVADIAAVDLDGSGTGPLEQDQPVPGIQPGHLSQHAFDPGNNAARHTGNKGIEIYRNGQRFC